MKWSSKINARKKKILSRKYDWNPNKYRCNKRRKLPKGKKLDFNMKSSIRCMDEYAKKCEEENKKEFKKKGYISL